MGNRAETTRKERAILKFIEEPINQETYGILITEQKDNILPTIISRSILINFQSMPKEVLKTELLTNGIDGKIVDVLAYLTNNVSEAITMIEEKDFNDLLDVFPKRWKS